MFRKGINETSLKPLKPLKRLGEILIEDDIITHDQLKKALEQQRESGGFLGQILIEQKAVSQDTLISYLAKQCQIPHLSLLNYRIGEEALSQVPRELCLKHYLVPVDKMGRILTLAMVDPLDTEALEEIKKHCPDLRIKPVLCSWEHFQATVKQLYAHEVQKPDNLEDKYAQLGALSQICKAPDDTEDRIAMAASDEDITSDNTVSSSSSAEFEESRTQAERIPAADSPEMKVDNASIQVIAAALRTSIRAAFADLTAAAGSKSVTDSGSITLQTSSACPAQNVLESIARNSGTQEGQLTKMAEAMLQSIESHKRLQTEQQGQLEKIAEAAFESVRQSAKLLEAHAVAESGGKDMRRQCPAGFTSVASFLSVDEGDVSDNTDIFLPDDTVVRAGLNSEHPRKTLTFDNFFAGEANRLTLKLARAVVETYGNDYNPIYLCGKVGLGKTHLLSAIGNASIAAMKDKSAASLHRTGYVSASHFTQVLRAAIADNALGLFRENYCHWDMLLLDDIQFLGGRAEVQEEFFRILDVLQQQGRQIIISGDKTPNQFELLEPRLASRVISGIVAELKPPEFEARMIILRHHADKEDIEVSDDVLSLVATGVSEDVRKMIGALRKIIALRRLEGGKITPEDAQRILNDLVGSKST